MVNRESGRARVRGAMPLPPLAEAAVGSVWNVPGGPLRAATRGRAPIAFARQVAIYLSHVAFGLGYGELARRFGRDRTTIRHACRLVEMCRDDPRLDLALDWLEQAVRLQARSLACGSGGMNLAPRFPGEDAR